MKHDGSATTIERLFFGLACQLGHQEGGPSELRRKLSRRGSHVCSGAAVALA